MRKILSFVTLAMVLGAGGCSWDLFTVHHIDVQQGNSLSRETVEQLRIGMTPDQVEFLMGTPMVRDVFRPDRWDYIYYLKPGNRPAIERRLTIFFENGQVVRIDKPQWDDTEAAEDGEDG